MARNLVSKAGELFHPLNPSLLDTPPPHVEETGHDVCYLGPNGETGHEHVVYCEDLPTGVRTNVSTWYLNPERHAMEWLAVVSVT